MLVLTRKKNQSIMVGENIEVIVVDIKGDQVKLGIKAPKDVAVHRKEIFEEIQSENKLASAAKIGSLDDLNKMISKPKKN